MTPSAYMTDEAWEKICVKLCKGIRSMPKIKDSPAWWCLLSLDGFGSHLNEKALQVFADYKILVIKEEGDSSQVCQAYDQLVAKLDKKMTRDVLDVYRFNIHGVVSQWELISCLNTAFNSCNPKAWRKSHIRVNTCPSKRLPFEEWVKAHKEQVSSADEFFKSRTGLFDAMPAVWKNMTAEDRQTIAALFREFEAEAEKDPARGVWHIDNVRRLMELGICGYV